MIFHPYYRTFESSIILLKLVKRHNVQRLLSTSCVCFQIAKKKPSSTVEKVERLNTTPFKDDFPASSVKGPSPDKPFSERPIQEYLDTSGRDSFVTVTSTNSSEDTDGNLEADSVSDLMWQKVGRGNRNLIDFAKEVYLPLSKIRLTALVVLTALEGYGMAPVTFAFDPIAFTSLVVGTTLTSACANSVNQILETPYDSQMNRTKNRPIIRGRLTPLHATTFAAVSGTAGSLILLAGTNPLTAALGLSNIFLYTCVYTPMKRHSIANTWVGSVVGAIPPMMGWAACTGGLEAGAWVLGAFLFCWQFPHFKALSWNLRAEYSRAGYRMSSVIDPGLCRRACLRHSVAMIPLSVLASYLDVTSWWFVVDSMPFNLILIYLSYRFYREGSSNTSKKLFRFSLLHIPVILFLMIISKNRKVEKPEVANDT